MARIKVTDPYTGVTVTVNDDSPQAKAWGESSPGVVAEPVVDPVEDEPVPTRKNRSRKSS